MAYKNREIGFLHMYSNHKWGESEAMTTVFESLDGILTLDRELRLWTTNERLLSQLSVIKNRVMEKEELDGDSMMKLAALVKDHRKYRSRLDSLLEHKKRLRHVANNLPEQENLKQVLGKLGRYLE